MYSGNIEMANFYRVYSLMGYDDRPDDPALLSYAYETIRLRISMSLLELLSFSKMLALLTIQHSFTETRQITSIFGTGIPKCSLYY